ncbi:FecR family protein [Microscilla marina]|uniref:Putative anti-sigma factor n=1 Tax=Microscilla marina ATCC 23134 TaxID=313606 RepID=A1ZW94_MICM2|nr:FecR domain-containing protein [Microscilla marina]EAY25332.1 putative anti-sigma factor [Microscilla marina ATCC 23134]
MEFEKYLELIIKKRHNKLSREEASLLDHWLQKSSDNQKIQEDIQQIWKLTQHYQESYEPIVQNGFDRFQQTIHASPINHHYTTLIVKVMQGNASTEEASSLEEWVNQKQENADLRQAVENVWTLTQQYQASYEPNAKAGLARFKDALANDEQLVDHSPTAHDELLTDLITKNLSRNISSEEADQLDVWLTKNNENKQLYEDLVKVWENTTYYQESYQPDTAQGLARFNQLIVDTDKKSDAPVKSLNKKSSQKFTLVGIAATVALLLVAGYWLFFQSSSITVVATANTTQTITLPDGSTVSLNKNSELSYDKKFDPRIVKLKGEAFFEVTKQGGKPFSIFSNGTKTEVLGTSFNIKTSNKNSDVEVTVITGKVAVSLEKVPQKRVLLAPGDKAVCKKQVKLIKKEKSSNQNFLAWKTRRLAFENHTLQNIIPELERFYQVKIELTNSKMLNCRFTGTFDNVALEEALEIIKFTFNASYTKSSNKYIIKGKGCN